MKELDGFNIPNFSPTADGSCAGDLAAASQAAQRGWWTCGGYTRATGTLSFLFIYLFIFIDDIISSFSRQTSLLALTSLLGESASTMAQDPTVSCVRCDLWGKF